MSRWFERQLGAFYYTLFEGARAMGLGRLASFAALVLFVAIAGMTLLVMLDVFAEAAGEVSTWPVSKSPRSIAAVAIVAGYFVWDRFASPERVRLFDSLDSTAAPGTRSRRRLKVVAFVCLLVGAYVAL